MGRSVAQQLIESHLVSGDMRPGAEIVLSIDQTLTQDATGTLVMLELEALALDRIKTEVSVQFVDHNLLPGLLWGNRAPAPMTSRLAVSTDR